jgi:glycosyltransferase involved in cell wall biosynthesis
MTVVYVVLGERRIAAAVRHVERLAADGVRVVLVAADLPDWVGVRLPASVIVHRVGSADRRHTLRAARHLLLAGPPMLAGPPVQGGSPMQGGSPVLGADLLIAGDPEALAVAWTVGRRHPRLPIRLEPSPEPDRRTAEADLAVVTPWYPGPEDPFAGAFVQAATAAVRPGFGRVSILHTSSWFSSPARLTGQLVAVAAERQADLSGTAVVRDTDEGELTRVAVPTAAGGTYAEMADAQARALRAVLPTGRIEAPLVHAHTGMLGGDVAVRLARPDARIVVTEHATFLPRVFAQPDGRRRYAEMLNRVDALLCVGRALHDQVAEAFPEHVGKLRIIGNAVDVARLAVRPAAPREPLRWLYIGRLMAHKGVLTLVDAFARIAAEDPRVTLTLVGAGPLAGEVAARIAHHGLAGRVTVRLPVPPEGVVAVLHEHDLLVHASRTETFGVTVVEAVVTGTPVLVARSAGPAETLAGIEDRVGGVFPPTEDPDVVAAAYRVLRARFGELDLPGARAELRARYGFAAVAARLFEVYSQGGGLRSAVPETVVVSGRRLTRALPVIGPEAVVRTGGRIGRRLIRWPRDV